MCRCNSTNCCVIDIPLSYGKSGIQVKTRNLLHTPCIIQYFSLFCWLILVFSISFDEKYFVYRSVIPNCKKNNGIKGIVYADESHRWAVDRFEFLGIFSECLRAKIVSVSHSHFHSQDAKLFFQRRANLKILNSAPDLLLIWHWQNETW